MRKKIELLGVLAFITILACAVRNIKTVTLASGMWPEGYKGFEFEVVGDSHDHFVLRVTAVHEATGVHVEDIYSVEKPSINMTLRIGKDLGWDERGFYVAEVLPPRH